MRILCASCLIAITLLTGCGNGTPTAPGDQPSSTATQTDDKGGGGGGY
ncbi:MAG: hypothetical protein QOI54_979 [Actinomycetota bacterium]|jgi:hypothetical protein|nr:hypothetical protein [Actinomycetota bacterium]